MAFPTRRTGRVRPPAPNRQPRERTSCASVRRGKAGALSETRQVICIRWGDKYGPEYVNRLYAMVERSVTPPFTFHCITDDTAGLRSEIRHVPLPLLGCDTPKGVTGIWGKSRLWNEKLGELEGPVLFLDLDVVVLGSLDPFFTHGDPDDVILARNPNTPFERLGQTSIFRFPIGKLAPVREAFLRDPQGVAETHRYEQRFVTRHAPDGVKFWPGAWIDLFKWHCVPPFPLNYLVAPKPRRDARVVLFPGPLNPAEALEGRWSGWVPHLPPLDHVRAAFDERRHESHWKHLRHYIRPCPWVAEAWGA